MKIQTPVGEVTFEGELSPASILTFEDGSETTLERWATLTNGACFQWISDAGIN